MGKTILEGRVAKLVALVWPLLIVIAASMELDMPIADPLIDLEKITTLQLLIFGISFGFQ